MENCRLKESLERLQKAVASGEGGKNELISESSHKALARTYHSVLEPRIIFYVLQASLTR